MIPQQERKREQARTLNFRVKGRKPTRNKQTPEKLGIGGTGALRGVEDEQPGGFYKQHQAFQPELLPDQGCQEAISQPRRR
jgi:hypothetical protein